MRGEVRVILPSPEGEEVTLALLGPGDPQHEPGGQDQECQRGVIGRPRGKRPAAEEHTVTDAYGDPLINTVTASGEDLLGLAVSDTDEVRVDVVHPDVLLTKVAEEGCAAVGELMTYTLTVNGVGDTTGPYSFRLLDLAGPAAEGGAVELRFSQDELASMLGVTRESVNKHLRFFKKRGAVDVYRRRIVLRSVDYLRRFA